MLPFLMFNLRSKHQYLLIIVGATKGNGHHINVGNNLKKHALC